jgi:nitrite reductase/ring-hydroxylating ferredoxin subunit/DMSO/TMAO reductase YedYZ heme-binding membrane subunit
MGLSYRAVSWNPQKVVYDRILGGAVLGYLGLFIGVGLWLFPDITIETLLLRATSTCAFLMLFVILSIGPLCRLDRRFLPLLYNRRHLGVSMFLVALMHGGLGLVQFHALGDTNPFVSLLSSNTRFGSLSQFPFQQLGAAALLILFLMAATSHDFWLGLLGAPAWKALHMLVYVAWALIVLHVTLGVLQAETSPVYAALLLAGVAWILGLHLVAGWRERRLDQPAGTGWVDVGPLDSIAEGRARIVTLGDERVAVFRWDGQVAALGNACQHQNGPLGEGRILDGCITCPWHGYQYVPATGRSPPPFHEVVPTYPVKVEAGRVLVHSQARHGG